MISGVRPVRRASSAMIFACSATGNALPWCRAVVYSVAGELAGLGQRLGQIGLQVGRQLFVKIRRRRVVRQDKRKRQIVAIPVIKRLEIQHAGNQNQPVEIQPVTGHKDAAPAPLRGKHRNSRRKDISAKASARAAWSRAG